MTADYNGWNDAPEAEREAMDLYSRQELEREALAEVEELRKSALTMKKYYEGPPAARTIQESIIQARLQIVKGLERRTQAAAAGQLLLDWVKRLAA
jgi:hypothetical protein